VLAERRPTASGIEFREGIVPRLGCDECSSALLQFRAVSARHYRVATLTPAWLPHQTAGNPAPSAVEGWLAPTPLMPLPKFGGVSTRAVAVVYALLLCKSKRSIGAA
jgi:hypothetical protein